MPVALPWTMSPWTLGSNQCQARKDASIMRKLAIRVTQREAWSRNLFGRPRKCLTTISARMMAEPMTGRNVAQTSTLSGRIMKPIS